LWGGPWNANGYGILNVIGVPMLAHRASYIRYRSEIPDGMFICHHCDVPACVNPDHLFVGSNSDNMRDMLSKGRRRPYRRGSAHQNSRLTEEDVRSIRASSENYTVLGRRYGVTKHNIYAIRSRKAWKHLP
jgi:carbonic anhydrase/acetyltransferase-like protein (isoleucine patch superfamily)